MRRGDVVRVAVQPAGASSLVQSAYGAVFRLSICTVYVVMRVPFCTWLTQISDSRRGGGNAPVYASWLLCSTRVGGWPLRAGEGGRDRAQTLDAQAYTSLPRGQLHCPQTGNSDGAV